MIVSNGVHEILGKSKNPICYHQIYASLYSRISRSQNENKSFIEFSLLLISICKENLADTGMYKQMNMIITMKG